MSYETETLLEKAIIDHMTDEGLLHDGELLAEWCVVGASIPEQQTEELHSTVLVTAPESMLSHHVIGLLYTHLHDIGTERD